jgi:hypothetical protein
VSVTPVEAGWTTIFTQDITAPSFSPYDAPHHAQMVAFVRCYAPGEGYGGSDNEFRFTLGGTVNRGEVSLTEWAVTSAPGSDIPAVPGDPPPPSDCSGYGPPGEDTACTTSYTDLASHQTWTFNGETEEWELDAGSGDEESGVYDFEFAASTTWVINHLLVGFPRVTLRNTSGAVIQGFVVYDSNSQITVTFSEAVAGTAHLG